MAQMASVESTHSIVASLASEAHAAQSTSRVGRLVRLLRKLLKRLKTSMRRDSKQTKKSRGVCKSSLKTVKAIGVVAKQELKVALIKFKINRNLISKSRHHVSRDAESIGRATTRATSFDHKLVLSRDSLKGDIGRMKRSNAELGALIRKLRRINSRLTSHGLVELSSAMSAAAKGRSTESESTSMILAVAAMAESGSDISDVRRMIKKLIKTLLADLKINKLQIGKRQRQFKSISKTLRNSADAQRTKIKSMIKSRDNLRAAGDRLIKKNLALQVRIVALRKTIKSNAKHIKLTRRQCRSAKKDLTAKRASRARQIRVVKQIIKRLKNEKVSAAVAKKIANINLSLPMWKIGKWSKCSTKCGLGKQSRRVSCSGKSCIGAKPMVSKWCTKGPCQADCVVTPWSAFSKCSSSCTQKRTRKVLAPATAGGKSCPSPSGLTQIKKCKVCKSKSSRSKRSRRVSKKVFTFFFLC
jgi:hypothetical protein